MAPQRLSEKGRQFLKTQEGVRRYAYNDSAGNATFGIGHLIHEGPVRQNDRRHWGTPENPKPMSMVWRVFDEDIKEYEAAVRNAVQRRMWQHRFDAAVSLCFNIGTGAFRSSTVARELRERHRGFTMRAADAFLLWRRPPELLPRRLRERRLFLEGDYG